MSKSKKEEGLSKDFWVVAISISSFLFLVILIGIICFVNRKPDVDFKEDNQGGNVSLHYSTSTKGLSLVNVSPTTDDVGMKNMTPDQYFDFSVQVDMEDAPKVNYEISLLKDEDSTISDDDIRVYLEREDQGTYEKVFGPERFVPSKNYSSAGSEIGSMVLANVKKIKSGTDNYRLRIWLSEDAQVSGGTYSVEVDIHAVAK